MNKHNSRRDFLKTAGAAASVLILSESLLGAIGSSGPYTRRDISGIALDDPLISSYRKAIKAMRSLPSTNPLSWDYQAAIHGTTVMPALTGWNSCEHGTYYFWSWHRMYLYWFERIVRKLSDDATWTLPYWNWSAANSRQLPAMFRDQSSELYTPFREPAMNDGTGSLPEGDVDYSSAFSESHFTSASGMIEGTPHGAVHVDVGGASGWMGAVPTAAQDPIFYLHHSNMDRLWNLWLAQGGGRTNPLNDADWKSRKFTFFDENGNEVKMSGCDMLRAAEQLDYVYENEPTQVTEYCKNQIQTVPMALKRPLLHLPNPPELNSERVSFSTDITQVSDRLVSISENKTQKVFLDLVRVEAEKQPGVVWEVYVGLPTDATPEPKGVFFVGNVVIFGAGVRTNAHGEYHPAHFSFDASRAIAEALKRKEKELRITFVPHGVLINGKPSRPKAAASVRIGSADLMIQTERER